MTFGSLFAGIGGLDLGLERAGLRVRWQVEIDPYACRVLARHWPDVPRYGDIRTLTGEELERVDLICGGFPCTDISNAGKRAGIDGEQSGLWADYARIVRALRPRFVLVENVAALLHRGFGRVVGDLAACGYDAEWDCIPASAVGARHQRDRVFIVAYPAGARPSERPSGARRRPRTARRLQPQRLGSHVAHAFGPGLEVGQGAEGLREFAATVGARTWPAEPRLDGTPDGVSAGLDRSHPIEPWERGVSRTVAGGSVPDRIARLRTLGNAVVPQVAEFIGRRILAAAGDGS